MKKNWVKPKRDHRNYPVFTVLDIESIKNEEIQSNKRIFDIATNEGDIILDAFLGSGTSTGVAHKMNRKYIGIELGEHIVEYVVSRMKKVIKGESGGISQDVNWRGRGDFVPSLTL